MKRTLELDGGYGENFATVLASKRTVNRGYVVLPTVDTVGILLDLLAQPDGARAAAARLRGDRAARAARAAARRA